MTAPQNGTARWQLWVSMVGVGIVVFGSFVSLFATVTGAANKVAELEVRIATNETLNREQASQIRVICASLKEVETQFRSADQVRNIIHANDMRIHSMLWQKSFGSPYPTDNSYYPTIAQDSPEPCR